MNMTRFATLEHFSLRRLAAQAFEPLDQPVHFLERVVMHRSHPDDPVRVAESERLHQPLRMKVAETDTDT